MPQCYFNFVPRGFHLPNTGAIKVGDHVLVEGDATESFVAKIVDLFDNGKC